MEGVGNILAGLWGTIAGTSSYSENVGAIGITKVRFYHYNLFYYLNFAYRELFVCNIFFNMVLAENCDCLKPQSNEIRHMKE